MGRDYLHESWILPHGWIYGWAQIPVLLEDDNLVKMWKCLRKMRGAGHMRRWWLGLKYRYYKRKMRRSGK